MKPRLWLKLPFFLLGGAGVVAVYLWVQLLSPFGFVYPEDMGLSAN